MELKLPLSKVKEFISLSKAIETEQSDFENLQVLKYIKIEVDFDICTITKTSLRSFIQFTFDLKHEDCVMIIMEKELIDYCSSSNREDLFITQSEEKETTLTDGYIISEFYNGKYEVKDFFKIPKAGKPTCRLSKEVLLNFNIAKIYSGEDDLRPSFKYIYIDSVYDDKAKEQVSYMYASTMRILYLKKFRFNLPKLALSKDECSTLSKYEYVDYCEVKEDKNWNIYKWNNVVYGFRQSDEALGFPYQMFLNIEKKNYIKFKTDDFINFCNSTKIRMSKADGKATYINSSAKISGTTAELICNDNENRKKNKFNTKVEVVGQPFDFNFDHSQMLDIFKSLPFSEICISDEQTKNEQGAKIADMLGIFSLSDGDYFSLVSKII